MRCIVIIHAKKFNHWYKCVPGGGEGNGGVAARCSVGDRRSHVNLISRTLMGWTDVWPGRQEVEKKRKEKRTRSQAFQQTAYVPLRWLFHLGLVSANNSEKQSRKTLTRSCQVSSGEMLWVRWVASIPKPVSVCGLSLNRFQLKVFESL